MSTLIGGGEKSTPALMQATMTSMVNDPFCGRKTFPATTCRTGSVSAPSPRCPSCAMTDSSRWTPRFSRRSTPISGYRTSGAVGFLTISPRAAGTPDPPHASAGFLGSFHSNSPTVTWCVSTRPHRATACAPHDDIHRGTWTWDVSRPRAVGHVRQLRPRGRIRQQSPTAQPHHHVAAAKP